MATTLFAVCQCVNPAQENLETFSISWLEKEWKDALQIRAYVSSKYTFPILHTSLTFMFIADKSLVVGQLKFLSSKYKMFYFTESTGYLPQ